MHMLLMPAILLLLASGVLNARDASVSVAWNTSAACGTSFSRDVLQQDLKDRLGMASIAVSRVSRASLLTDMDCHPATTRSMSVQQCLSLSQPVAEPSATNGLHLATTWRSCRSYFCSRQNCGPVARATQRLLLDEFIPAFRTLAAHADPAGQPSAPHSTEGIPIPILPGVASETVVKPGAIFYMLYILTCVAVVIRWEWYRKTTIR